MTIKQTKRRSRLLGRGLGAAVLALVSTVGVLQVLLPSLVRSQIIHVLAEQTGLVARVDRVAFHIWGCSVSGVTLQSPDGRFRGRVAILEVHGAPWNLYRGSLEAVELLRLTEVNIEVERKDSFAEATPVGPRIGSSKMRQLLKMMQKNTRFEVDGFHISVEDSFGNLLSLQGHHAHASRDDAVMNLPWIQIGELPAHRIALGDLQLTARRTAEGWSVSEVSLGTARLLWAHAGEDAQNQGAGALMIDRLFRLIGGHGSENLAAPRDLPQVSFRGVKELIPSGLIALVSKLRKRFLDRSIVRWSEVSVALLTDDGTVELLQHLSGSLIKDGQSCIRLQGQGRRAEGGEVVWDLNIDSEQLDVEGTLAFDGMSLAVIQPLLPDVLWHKPQDTRLDGRLSVKSDENGTLKLALELEASGLEISSPRVAPSVLRFAPVHLNGTLVFENAFKRIGVRDLRVAMGAAAIIVNSDVELSSSHFALTSDLRLPLSVCEDVFHAFPKEVLGEVAGFHWIGDIAIDAHLELDTRDLSATDLDVQVANDCDFVEIPGHLDTERLRGIFTHRVRTLEQDFFELTTGPGSAHWTPLLAVSPYLMHAVIKQEDSSFAWNSGFAVFAIRDALIKNIRLGRFAYGASTITMQLAKNIFLHRDKTLVRKFQELFFAWYLNSELEKSEVLELYLNVVEFGPSIYGVRQASLHYFGVEPRDLSPAEACFLAAVLPAPTTYHQQWEDGVLSLSMKKKIRRMLQRLIKSERIDQAAHDFGVNELEDPMFFRSLEESALPEEQSQFAGHGHLNRLWSDEPSPSGQSTSSRELIQRVETEQVERPWIGEARPLPFLSPSVPLETEASERESYRTGE